MRILLLLILIPSLSFADVLYSTPNGFQLKIEREVQVNRKQAYQQFLMVNQWWHPDHTWFGDASGLTITPAIGNCFCERDGDKQALHMSISYVDPNNEIRMVGGLGPLQMLGVTGGMSWKFEAINDTRSKITFHYQVTGFMNGGLDKLAPIVDNVQTIQIDRLANLLNTGQVETSDVTKK